jgi:hypothetical protein
MNKSIAKYEAFKEVIESGKADTMAMLIYKELLKEPRTIVHFRQTLGMAHQSCTAMLCKLEDSGWVYKDRTITINKQSFTLFKAETDSDIAKERALQIETYKMHEWINRGYKRGWFDQTTAINIAQQLKLEL